jgi:hypothetical protein
MHSIPDQPYDGTDDERNDDILDAMADQLGEFEEPGDVDPGTIGAAYRLGLAAGKTDDEIPVAFEPMSVKIFKLGERSGRRLADEARYHEGYADGLEQAFQAMDAATADQTSKWLGEQLRGAGIRGLTPRRRPRPGRRPVRVATARRVSS